MLEDDQYLRNALCIVADQWVGVRETGGNNRGEIVKRFQMSVDGKADGEPWCMAFVQFCIKEARAITEGIFLRSILLTDKLFKTEHVITAWNKTDKFQRLNGPIVGSIILWQKYINDVGTTCGHAGIVVRVLDDSTIVTIEGNTSGDSGIVRDGSGVYKLTRHYKMRQGDLRLLGFINPW
jgi:hypothetical protein